MDVGSLYNHSGDDSIEDPPVLIPNTEVKLDNAQSTWLDTAWEDRELPHFIFLVSSAVEHPAVNRRVAGPNPARGAKKRTKRLLRSFFVFRHDLCLGSPARNEKRHLPLHLVYL